jgi:hypothetical protein
MLPRPNYSIIECEGVSYFKRAFFQFHEKLLYTIILILNPQKVDYYSLFTTLTDKYGPFKELDPQRVVWDDGNVRLSLERPLQVKYIDINTFESLKEEGRARESMDQISLDRFLEEF